MKDLVNCENIEKILISEKMKCDVLIISGESLQYSLLYHSEELKTFTDNIAKTIIYHFGRQTMINAIPKVINSNKYPNINLIELSFSRHDLQNPNQCRNFASLLSGQGICL